MDKSQYQAKSRRFGVDSMNLKRKLIMIAIIITIIIILRSHRTAPYNKN